MKVVGTWGARGRGEGRFAITADTHTSLSTPAETARTPAPRRLRGRPVGGPLMGAIADRQGRRAALTVATGR
ncbi:hypothetical protein [Streptomyces sp. NBC_01373]|uniref:hypothetical protein n=1 Tax=Streptomyces sp. NBC_01373 TaxID=2903843 RepID=UPI00225570E9|nr:hypothetical protein [Streptomyces sp. NBC_01373]MCX4704937.1 hypothetical protein [Streptomyces sp. NBC_01373]